MKGRFTNIDLTAVLTELRQKLVGMRIVQVYDVDHKTYLFKMGRKEEKSVLLIESGIRIHTTEFEWPKHNMPSGFSIKMRKHLSNKRLESIKQVGVDRIIDMQFGINEAEYHVILELYDRGNIVLTDYDYTILNILRPRSKGDEDVKLVVREKYPLSAARQMEPVLDEAKIKELIQSANDGDNLRKILNPHVIYGSAVIDHVLLEAGFQNNIRLGTGFNLEMDWHKLQTALVTAENIIAEAMENPCKGYLIQKIEKLPQTEGIELKELVTNIEFHPFLFSQHKNSPFTEIESFNSAVDQFFSKLESQKIDSRTMHQEKEALKKLTNIKRDHEKRINSLQHVQLADKEKAELIEMNLPLIDRAILIIRNAIANQISWSEVWELIKEAQVQGDPVAKTIKSLKLEKNHFTMLLQNPYSVDVVDLDDEHSDDPDDFGIKPQLIDIDLDLSAYANARRYFDQKKNAAKKEQKTLEASVKAYKSAEKKTKKALKDVAAIAAIVKARKTHWFEKFQWFISSENYLIIGGRDVQQNELIVKRHLRPGDIYVHADLHGASSVIIKNLTGEPIPPKTLGEAGTMAICYSVAWDAKVVTSAWWVYHHQVSKTAPTGEYLSAGSFMIRGKKNYLPPSHLIMGFGFLFKIDESCIENHLNDRKVTLETDMSISSEVEQNEIIEEIEENSGSDLESENENEVENDDGAAGSNDSNQNDSSEDVENEEVEFPDVEVNLPFVKKEKSFDDVEPSNNIEVEVLYLGDDKPVIIHPSQKKKQVKIAPKVEEIVPEKNENPKPNQNSKRRQKSKLKKIKEKYKDQDEADRQLMMHILGSAGTGKEKKSKKGKQKQDDFKKTKQNKPDSQPIPTSAETSDPTIVSSEQELTVQTSKEQPQAFDEEQEVIDESIPQKEDEKILSSLISNPLTEDILLFAIPVCAPYSVMISYKFKIKVLPGSGKKGRAAKTALEYFSRDRATTPFEKDLLRSVKDQDIARNLPGKVKLSAPNFSKHK